MKVLFSQWMRELDFDTINNTGIPSIVLMENASREVCRIIRERFPAGKYRDLIVVAGPGNNGGDGIAVGRILAQWGYMPRFLFVSDPGELTGDPLINFNIIRNLGLEWSQISDGKGLRKILNTHSPESTVLIDAIFGTGLKRPVTDGKYLDLIKEMNRSGLKIASIDLPSGLSDVFPPRDGSFVMPEITVTFQAVKTAHIFPDDRNRCGEIFVVDIGIPAGHVNRSRYFIRLSEPLDFSALLEKRASGMHKGNFGHGLVVAGSDEKPGASILSSVAVLRTGAGLSTAVVSENNRDLIMSAYPEVMTLNENEFSESAKIPEGYDCILVGPGMGVSPKSLSLVKKIISGSMVPVVLDADALNNIVGETDLLEQKRRYPLIITPHPGEFSRLSGLKTEEIVNDPITAARDFSMKYDLFTVLKGHYTVISSPGGDVVINQTGNPGMATAGSGDVLGGMITGMISQFSKNFPIMTILQAAVFIHGYAGDIAASEKGESPMIASDITDSISDAFRRINEFESLFRFS